jgi:hypothetical protein
MGCVVCEDLERAFKTMQKEYLEACSAAYYRVSRKFAAYKNVDMERARNELEEHRLACVSALNDSALSAGSSSTAPHAAGNAPRQSPSKRQPGLLVKAPAAREPSKVNADFGRRETAFSS